MTVQVLIFLCALAMPGVAAAWPQQPPYTPTSQKECSRIGGKWMKLLKPEYFCAPPTTDAGKACSDSANCQGHCAPIEPKPIPEQKAKGACSSYYDPAASGLRFYLEKGAVKEMGVH